MILNISMTIICISSLNLSRPNAVLYKTDDTFNLMEHTHKGGWSQASIF